MTRTSWTWRLAIAAALLTAALPALAGKSGEKTADAKGAAAAKALAIGSKAPMADTKMKNVDGSEVSIADVKGAKGTLVIFSCNACPWAKAWESRIAEIGLRTPDAATLRAGDHFTFVSAAGNVDVTEVVVDLRRATVFGGITVRATDAIQLSGQLYSVPEDVTTVRLTVAYSVLRKQGDYDHD